MSKTFTVPRPPKDDIVFTFGDAEYHALGKMAWNALAAFSAPVDGTELTLLQIRRRTIDFIVSCLRKGERKRFEAALLVEDDPVEFDELDALASELIKAYSGNPGGQSDESLPTSTNTETTSSVDSSSPATTEPQT